MTATEDRAADSYEAHCRRRLLERYAPVVPLGGGFNLVLAGLCAAAGELRAAGGLTSIAAAFAFTYPLSQGAWARRHPHVLIMGIAALCAVGAATLTSMGSLFEVSGWAILLVCWGMGATQLPMPPRVVAAGIVMQLVVFEAVLHGIGASSAANGGIVYGLQICGAVLALDGSRRLHQRDRTLFDEENELRRREAELRLREAELSARGQVSENTARRLVEEHLVGAKTEEALAALLTERVRLRSRQIAQGIDDTGPLPSSPEPKSSRRGTP